MIHYTANCRFSDLKAITVFAITVADQVYKEKGQEHMWLTSVDDSQHMPGSRHFIGLAFDLRTRDIPGGSLGAKAREIHAALKARLSPGFDVVLENDHIHVEYDPS